MSDRAGERAAEEAAYDRGQQRDVRTQQLAKGQQELETAEATADQKRQMNDVMATPGVIGDDGRFDVQLAQRTATEKGYKDVLDDVLTFGKEWNDGVEKGLLTREQIESAKRANQPQGYTLSPGQQRFAPGGEVEAEVPVTPPKPTMREVVVKGPNGRPVNKLVSEEELMQGVEQYERPRAAATVNVSTGGDPQGAEAPLDPDSQDIMSQSGLSYNGFLAATGRMSLLARDQTTRNAASAEVAKWARERGMDLSTLASQYKAYNETLENNIARYNRTLLAEGEINADVDNLLTHVKETGLGEVRAINAAKQWLKGELNDPNAAEYAFYLNQLVNDIALYNSASQGRAALQADLDDAKSVVQRGISSGSLTGMQKAIGQSVTKMGTVLEGAVNRSRKNVWDLFGVGDKYKAKPTATDQPPPRNIGRFEVVAEP